MLSIEEEIRKAQEERSKLKSTLQTSKLDESRYDTSIQFGDDGEGSKKPKQKTAKNDGVGKMDDTRARVRSALNSYTAPKDIMDNLPIEEESSTRKKGVEEEDVFKDYKPKTIAEREDEYRARWRKRQLSPPRGVDVPGARSYRDVMIEQQLEREKDELVRKIQKQKREEETKARKSGKSGWDEGSEGQTDTRESDSSSSSREKWVLSVFKSNERIEGPMFLDTRKIISFGRDEKCDVPIAHASCSKRHATVQFKHTGGTLSPYITDLGSTNLTFLNSRKLEPQKAYAINAGDIVKFGGSTREYIFLRE
eukprot:TRINITY_DN13957_c0_g1_i1.p1 TRINITY_DN13957_c0_g1~~TRINITY_DN13957_c0_g1_i1.p1  ORF type:complete len:309 (-),score=71.08 TRINITY_DN13957_c0_g1_i1:106-1032(-)